MKKTLMAAVVVVLGCTSLWAQQGDLGGGLMAGDGVNASVKYFMTGTHAMDGGFGIENQPKVYADYLWNGWRALPQPKSGKLDAYVGLGGRVDTSDDQFGIRTVAGLGYWIANHPVEISAELAPVFPVARDSRVDVTGGLGVRYYFQGVNK